MKKITFLLVAMITLAACSRQSDELPGPVQDSYFSKVNRWKDGRTPAVDTVWTLWLFNQQMVDSFAQYHNKIYFESATHIEQGVLFKK